MEGSSGGLEDRIDEIISWKKEKEAGRDEALEEETRREDL